MALRLARPVAQAFRHPHLARSVRLDGTASRFPYSTVREPTADSIASSCRKVICIGRNYVDHIKELGNTAPSSPFFFLKPPSSLLPPSGGPVLRPAGVTMHYEVELALLMGRRVSNLDPDDAEGAFAAISHYLLAIDMTGRNVQDEAKRKGLPWSIAKGFDTFCPISEPVPRAALSPAALDEVYGTELWLDVNGEARQRDRCELMLFKIPRILSEVSGVMALEAGDLVLTGTPKGVGAVTSGDVMTAGMRLGSRDVEGVSMRVEVKDRPAGFSFNA